MTLSELMDQLGIRVATQVLSLWDVVSAGEMDLDLFADLAAVLVTLGNEQAQVLALTDFAAEILAATGAAPLDVPADGPRHALNEGRIRSGLTTLTALSGPEVDIRDRLHRLARSEVLEAAQRQYSDAIKASPQVTGWRRQLEGGACQLCLWWARDGRVWPADHVMPSHKGCACHPVPALGRDLTVTDKARRASNERRANQTNEGEL